MAAAGRPELTDAQHARGEQLAAALKRERTRQHGSMSIEAFAADAGISPNTLKKIERGEGSPGFFTIADLATYLGLSLDDLASARRKR